MPQILKRICLRSKTLKWSLLHLFGLLLRKISVHPSGVVMKNLLAAVIFVIAGIIVITISTSSLEIQGHPDNNKCIGECYANYVATQGNIVAQDRAKAEAAAAMSPTELGKTAYVSCQACHGADAMGGIGPQLSGRDAAYIIDALNTYKASGTRGAQSALMWGVAGPLSDVDMGHLGAYIESL
tara:strand:+ start:1347 stop:1895 length:549 start_codon:yes stop_codon:yes gene_type:complete